jgi:hypothetical protein
MTGLQGRDIKPFGDFSRHYVFSNGHLYFYTYLHRHLHKISAPSLVSMYISSNLDFQASWMASVFPVHPQSHKGFIMHIKFISQSLTLLGNTL